MACWGILQSSHFISWEVVLDPDNHDRLFRLGRTKSLVAERDNGLLDLTEWVS